MGSHSGAHWRSADQLAQISNSSSNGGDNYDSNQAGGSQSVGATGGAQAPNGSNLNSILSAPPIPMSSVWQGHRRLGHVGPDPRFSFGVGFSMRCRLILPGRSALNSPGWLHFASSPALMIEPETDLVDIAKSNGKVFKSQFVEPHRFIFLNAPTDGKSFVASTVLGMQCNEPNCIKFMIEEIRSLEESVWMQQQHQEQQFMMQQAVNNNRFEN
eukprot:GDKK01005394.1.p1 GENE.GDKK01005394.1~~GDKK01005394.1.p1  ORF type:complete len:214 (-),score=41.65 GDKK01005394.1:40-681(-)